MTYAPASRHVAGLMLPQHVDMLLASGLWCGTSTGSANAQVIAPPAAGNLAAKPRYCFVAGYTNTGAVTLSIDGGTTNTSLRKADGTAMAGNEIVAGTAYQVVFDGTYWRLIGGAGGGLSLPVTTKSANYTATAADAGGVLKFTTASTLTLPAASSVPAGWTILVVNRSAGSVSISAGSGDTVNGTTSQPVRSFFDMLVYRNTSNSFEVSAFGSSAVSSITTWNPADIDASLTLSGGNLTITSTASGQRAGRATTSISSGAYYYEFGPTTPDGCQIGWATSAASLAGYLGIDAFGWGYGADGKRWNNNSGVAYGTTWATGSNRIGCYAKSTATNVWNLWVSVNGVVQGGGDPIAGTSPMYSGVAGTIFPAFGDNSGTSAAAGTAYFTPSSWQTVPPVFSPLA